MGQCCQPQPLQSSQQQQLSHHQSQNIYDFDSVMQPETPQQKIAYSPFFVDIIHQKDKNIVYGYIRQKCQILFQFDLINSYYDISIDIGKLVLYYYCFGRYQYNGNIDEWTKEQLYGRYLPLEPVLNTEYEATFKGKSTWYNKSNNIQFNTKVAITKVKQINRNLSSLLRELTVSRTLFGHPSIRKLYDVLPPIDVTNFDSLTVVYEPMDTNLNLIFATNQYFETLHVQYMLYQILLGIKYIHNFGFILQNLRPSNILINADCTIKISSFVRAYSVDDVDGWYKGCRWYRAPETILMHRGSFERDIWSIGCIFAELLQMEKVNCPLIYKRGPLFIGDSCFPLSPKRHRTNGVVYLSQHDQMWRILDVIGCPKECEMEWITDTQALEYVKDTKLRMENAGRNCTLRFNLIDHEPEIYFVSGTMNDGNNLLKNLLQFDIRKRYSAKEALESAYFDNVRDVDLENISPPKVYEDTKQVLVFPDANAAFHELILEEIKKYS